MKLDIEALAHKAGVQASTEFAKAVDDDSVISWQSTRDAEFARLIVEQLAKEAEQCDKSTHPSDLANILRQLLEDK